MMIDSIVARWLLTAVFAGAALAVVLARPGTAGPARRAYLAVPAFCLAMCAAMIAMAWRPEPAAATRVQVAGFGCAAIAFLASWRTRPSLDRLPHVLMAGAMIWMLSAPPGAVGMRAPGHGQDTMAAMPSAGPPVPVLAATGLIAACCAAASIRWLARAIGPGLRVRDLAAAGQAAMSAGMTAMLMVML